MQVALFGSGAAGLSLHSSDLDVVLTGLAAPEPVTGGFDDASKRLVVACLRRLERSCCWGPAKHELGVASSRLIARARVPVLKLQLQGGLELDVSLNDDGGIKAASFLQSFQQDFTAVRPLTLLLKCVLKQRGLSEVYMGGLGSWSLVNMVLAHLMAMSGAGGQVDHLGSMLLSFLQRYGVDFDRARQAVAVKRGGFVSKASLGGDFGRKGILSLEDPLTGREVAGGSHRYADVEELFGKLHGRLQQALEQAQQQQQQQPQQQQQQQVRVRRRWGEDGDEYSDDDDYLDASNRSPTYKASIRQQRSGGSNGGSQWGLLELLLDCQEAMQRPGTAADDAPPAAAAAGGGWEADLAWQPQQYAGGSAAAGGGQWQWSSGAERGNGAAAGSGGMGGSRKRERWQRR
ncbi:hypothetical protein OEZ85_010360 [Tetradesmus obliquus]|uniref:PAP-associated domain-containing protein n=1 Tax=Tetradesmus obliquus TaxID=3088 RepID=A0ABY8TQU6_TETOB|nr:hypothetical protein OEZ85_010360 [Tetradesmus obliquus]